MTYNANMTVTTQTPEAQAYDIKCDSWEDYVEALRNPGDGPYDGLPTGTRVMREDGNIYLVTGDTICLKTLDGIYVNPKTLVVAKNQERAKFIAEMILEEEA